MFALLFKRCMLLAGEKKRWNYLHYANMNNLFKDSETRLEERSDKWLLMEKITNTSPHSRIYKQTNRFKWENSVLVSGKQRKEMKYGRTHQSRKQRSEIKRKVSQRNSNSNSGKRKRKDTGESVSPPAHIMLTDEFLFLATRAFHKMKVSL